MLPPHCCRCCYYFFCCASLHCTRSAAHLVLAFFLAVLSCCGCCGNYLTRRIYFTQTQRWRERDRGRERGRMPLGAFFVVGSSRSFCRCACEKKKNEMLKINGRNCAPVCRRKCNQQTQIYDGNLAASRE